MNLRYKTLSIVGGALGSLTLVLYGIASVLWSLNNTEVEQRLVQEQLSHRLWYLDVQLDELSRTAKKLATYDETYAYIQDRNVDYISSHYQATTLSSKNLNLNLLLFVDHSGNIAFQQTRKDKTTSQLRTSIQRLIQSSSSQAQMRQGFLPVANQILMVSVQPILKTNGDGPVRGQVIVGRWLSPLSSQQGVEPQNSQLSLKPVAHLSPDLQDIAQSLRSQVLSSSTPLSSDTKNLLALHPKIYIPQPLRYEIQNDHQLIGYQLLRDLFDQPSLFLQYPLRRLTYQQSQNSIHYILFALCFTGVFFTGLMLLLIEKIILKRLTQITRFLDRLKHQQNELSERTTIAGQDELSAVGQALNQLLDSLQTAQTIQQQQQTLLAEQNMQLEHACQVADTANRAKSDFLAMISHEMRTPLNGVIGMVELLMGTSLQPDQQELAQVILHSSHSLVSIIHDVLDFSKIESGKFELDYQPLNLRQVLADVCKLLDNQARKQGIDLGFTIAPSTPVLLLSDSVRLQQILINLMGNAIKFTPSGSVDVTVSRLSDFPSADERVDPDNEVVTLLFTVRDSGIGISKEGLVRLFKPFSQVNASVSRQYGGTGLGLAISLQLCHLLGGTLWVESHGHVGGVPPAEWAIPISDSGVLYEPTHACQTQGSAFYFTLTCATVPNPDREKESCDLTPSLFKEPTMTAFLPSAGSQSEPLHQLSIATNVQILLAEDNLINQKVAIRMLRKLGYEADIAQNGLEVLSMLQNRPYDLILMDALMPEMDGLQATIQIRQQTTLPNPYIIALTANTTGDFRQNCLDAGMNDFLAKPIRLAELVQAFERYAVAVNSASTLSMTQESARNSVISCVH